MEKPHNLFADLCKKWEVVLKRNASFYLILNLSLILQKSLFVIKFLENKEGVIVHKMKQKMKLFSFSFEFLEIFLGNYPVQFPCFFILI